MALPYVQPDGSAPTAAQLAARARLIEDIVNLVDFKDVAKGSTPPEERLEAMIRRRVEMVAAHPGVTAPHAADAANPHTIIAIAATFASLIISLPSLERPARCRTASLRA